MTTYKVTGSAAFMGRKPGETFDADLDPEQERRAKERGSIRVVKRGDHDDRQKEAATDE